MKNPPNNIVFFDGVCTLCNSTVDYIIQRDKYSLFHFASLQGKAAQEMIPENSNNMYSLIYYRNGVILEKSTAAIRIFSDLGGIRKAYLIFLILPLFIRDGVYNIIAKNRYQWFGQREHCRVPEAWIMNKFLD